MNKISRWKFPADKTYKTKNTHLTYLCYIVFFIAYQNKIQQKHVQTKHKNGKRKQYIYVVLLTRSTVSFLTSSKEMNVEPMMNNKCKFKEDN